MRFLLPQLAIFGLVLESLQIRWIPKMILSESVRCGWACLAPHVKFAAAPGHSARTKANRAGELLLGHEPVDRRSTQTRHLHDGRHAQKDGRHSIVSIDW